jgi:hypothetical protein
MFFSQEIKNVITKSNFVEDNFDMITHAEQDINLGIVKKGKPTTYC